MVEIIEPSARDPRIVKLIDIHLRFCREHTPSGSGHAVSAEAAGSEAIRYWLAMLPEGVAGCVGLKRLDDIHAEIKTLHVAERFRGRGIGVALMESITGHARRQKYQRISLETGKSEGFAASRHLYKKLGFRACAPFGTYAEDPFSYCMTKAI